MMKNLTSYINEAIMALNPGAVLSAQILSLAKKKDSMGLEKIMKKLDILPTDKEAANAYLEYHQYQEMHDKEGYIKTKSFDFEYSQFLPYYFTEKETADKVEAGGVTFRVSGKVYSHIPGKDFKPFNVEQGDENIISINSQDIGILDHCPSLEKIYKQLEKLFGKPEKESTMGMQIFYIKNLKQPIKL